MTVDDVAAESTHDVLTDELAGETCPVLDECEGTLEESTYKENAALVCDECGAPATQVWTE